jgi:uncharacterized protein
LRYFVLKVHSRCDLACDHCYVYRHADQSWHGRPHAMDTHTVRAAGKRIAEHAATHRLPWVQVILHGGEPLLLGADRLNTILEELAATIAPVTRLDLRMQSNGLQLSPAIADVLVRHRVKVGISLDGDRAANDRHRRYANGASSHARLLRALRLLRSPAYRDAYAGILCTVDIENDPIRVYQALLAERPPRIDFLLPHATWDRPPPRPPGDPAPYATWLGRIHDRWLADGRPVPIRLFDSLASTLVGGPSGTEAVGLDPAEVMVIETDGSWEQADSMKTAYHGAPATGYDVFSHGVDDVAGHPGMVARQSGLAGVCATCRACPVVRRCGGGLYAHRYRTGTGFDNPSVYCADLKTLIGQMDRKARLPMPDPILDDLATGYGSAASVEHLLADEVRITTELVRMVGETEAGSDAWQLLDQVDAEAPAAVTAVLAHPYVRTWAVRYLKRDRDEPDRGYLAGMAAAAAAHAGMATQVSVPVRDGLVHLPTLGAYAFGPEPPSTVTLSIADGQVELAGAAAHWWPVRRLDSDGLTIPIEDTDPYRDCHEWPVAPRLTGTEVESWQELVSAAWQSIHRDAPGQVPAAQVAFRALLPLRPDPTGSLLGATTRNAFGAVGTARPAGADELATLLVHEIQHVKLGALLDLYDLYHPAYRELIEVPWRTDRRPVEAALQGAYAHLALADIWRARGEANHFRRYRAWVGEVIELLLRTGALTPDGERFVVRMRQTVEG